MSPPQSARAVALALCSSLVAAQNVQCNLPVREDYVGMSMVRHGFDYMPEELYRGMNDTYRQLGYDRISHARISGVRTWYAAEWAMPGGWGTPLNFSNPRFEAFAQWVSDMKQLGVPVILNAGWWFTQATCGFGSPATCTPDDASLAIYTAWISQSVAELVQRRGLTNVGTLLLFTEPFTYDSGNMPPGYTQQTYYTYAVHALHRRMVADGTRQLVKFLGPNDGGLSWPSIVQALNFSVSTMNDVIDIWSSHDYDMGTYARWLQMFENATIITNTTGE